MAPEQFAAGAIERHGLRHILGRIDARQKEMILPKRWAWRRRNPADPPSRRCSWFGSTREGKFFSSLDPLK